MNKKRIVSRALTILLCVFALATGLQAGSLPECLDFCNELMDDCIVDCPNEGFRAIWCAFQCAGLANDCQSSCHIVY